MAQQAVKKVSAVTVDIMIAVAVVAVVFMIIIPVPTFILDTLIGFNLMISLVVLLTVLYIKNAVEFSIFPSLLLMTTVFRLALSVSTTRMILSEGVSFDGAIIRAFGEFVVGGNYVVGLVVFLIITAVQFIVITKGATRTSEVAARFRLDAMATKHMAVDGELASGLITEEQAKKRREDIQSEADFYGSMDGASKFIKGDVIVGLIIVFIDIIGGILIGVIMRGEPLGTAASTYLLLTVGDGLVAQIPALLFSTATGIIVTRAVSKGSLGEDVRQQLTGQPKVFLITAGFLFFLGVLPGFPKVPLFGLGILMFVFGWRMRRVALEDDKGEVKDESASKHEPEVLTPMQPELLELEIGFALVPLVDESQGGDLLDRIRNLRKRSANEMGIVVPPVRIRDNPRLGPNQYSIRIRGVDVGKGDLQVDKLLVINPRGAPDGVHGIDTRDPTFGQAARWIERDISKAAEELGYTVVDCPSVLATHLGEILKTYAPELITMQQTQKFMDTIDSSCPAIMREVKDKGARLGDIQKVLQNLLRERVSISNMERILELVAEHFEPGIKSEMLTERVRQGMAMQISSALAESGVLKVVEVNGETEELLSDAVDVDNDGNMTASLDPDILNALIQNASQVMSSIEDPYYNNVILCTAPNRLFLQQIFEKSLPSIRVISYNELSRNIRLEIVGQLGVQDAVLDQSY